MRAMILAAGRGERMRPLTDHCPKPLLPAADKPLIVYHLERLAAAGFKDIVINHAHLGEQLVAALGNGSQWGLSITWSAEPVGALETAGGICQALPHLENGSDTPFLVVNGDIYCDWPIQKIRLNESDLAEFVELQKTFANSENSWSVNIKDIDPTTYDLSAKNPNKKEENTLRHPQEILEEMKALDEESSEILHSILGML